MNGPDYIKSNIRKGRLRLAMTKAHMWSFFYYNKKIVKKKKFSYSKLIHFSFYFDIVI